MVVVALLSVALVESVDLVSVVLVVNCNYYTERERIGLIARKGSYVLHKTNEQCTCRHNQPSNYLFFLGLWLLQS